MDYNFTSENKASRRQEFFTKELEIKEKEIQRRPFISTSYLLTEHIQ